MIFRQVIHEDLGCASYLIGDEKAGVAAVVDPQLCVETYLEHARYAGVTIERIFETHNHADHVSGHGRLVAATGAGIHIHEEARPAYPHHPFVDGEQWDIGRLRVEALHTPGHRPEHTAFSLADARRSSEPWAVLTGDTVFVNDVARPDLAIDSVEGARLLFRSVRDEILALADHVELWPGHLGGSMCGGPTMDTKICSTVGFEKRHNRLLAIADEDTFVRAMLADLAPQPPNFAAIVELNRGSLHTNDVELPGLAAREVEERMLAGALVVDVRDDGEFDAAHVPNAIAIPMLRRGFATKLAWLTARDRETVFVGRDDADGRRAGKLAHAVGVRGLAGFLHGGMTSWHREKRLVESIQRVGLPDLAKRLEIDPRVQVVDVRDASEWSAGHVPNSISVPWRDITAFPASLDPERPMAVVCASGQRAATAASLLRRYGAADVMHVVDGGVPTWQRLGLRLEADGHPAGMG